MLARTDINPVAASPSGAAMKMSAGRARRSLRPSEIVAIKRTLEPRMRAEAQRRQRAGGAEPGVGQWSDVISTQLGLSRKTMMRAEAVIVAAEKNPKRFGHLASEMDRTGNINRAWKRLCAQQCSGRSAIFGAVEIRGKPIGSISVVNARNLLALIDRYIRRLQFEHAILVALLRLAPADDSRLFRSFIPAKALRLAVDRAKQRVLPPTPLSPARARRPKKR